MRRMMIIAGVLSLGLTCSLALMPASQTVVAQGATPTDRIPTPPSIPESRLAPCVDLVPPMHTIIIFSEANFMGDCRWALPNGDPSGLVIVYRAPWPIRSVNGWNMKILFSESLSGQYLGEVIGSERDLVQRFGDLEPRMMVGWPLVRLFLPALYPGRCPLLWNGRPSCPGAPTPPP